MSRHRRTAKLTEPTRDDFVELAQEFHSRLMPFLREVDPRSSDYRLINGLSDVLRSVVEKLSGRDAPWCIAHPGAMPRHHITSSSDSTASVHSVEMPAGGGAWIEDVQED